MSNLKLIIVDEERLARLNLRRLLEPFPDLEISGETNSCAGALELVNIHNPQLIFLDIQLHGETGFDLLELLNDSIKVIFVTAYDEDVLNTIEMSQFDYLSKPVNPESLREAIEIVKEQVYHRRSILPIALQAIEPLITYYDR